MTFRMVDGRIYRGATYADVVQDMRTDKLRRARSRKRYRETTAERVRSLYGAQIDASSDQAFVSSLERAGLMEEITK